MWHVNGQFYVEQMLPSSGTLWSPSEASLHPLGLQFSNFNIFAYRLYDDDDDDDGDNNNNSNNKLWCGAQQTPPPSECNWLWDMAGDNKQLDVRPADPFTRIDP